MNLNHLKTFTKLVEQESFSKTAEILKQPKSRVSRNIARLEEELGITLVNRTTRQTHITEVGKEFYQKISLHLKAIEYEISQLFDNSPIVNGKLKITAPEDMAHTVLPVIVSSFSHCHPRSIFTLMSRIIMSTLKRKKSTLL